MSQYLNFVVSQAVENLNKQDFSQAHKYLELAEQIAPNDFDVLHLMGVLHGMQNNHQQAKQYFHKTAELFPQVALAHFNLANAMMELGEIDQSLLRYKRAIELDANQPEYWTNAGVANLRAGDNHEATRCFDAAIQLSPTFAQAWLNKAQALCQLSDPISALSCFDQALRIQPDLLQAWMGKANLLCELQRYSEALACYDTAVQHAPQYPVPWMNKGNALFSLKDTAEAIRCYDEALRLHPSLSQAWCNKGNALIEQRQYEQAIKVFDQAMVFQPQFPAALSGRGVAQSSLRQDAQALASFDQAIALDSNYIHAWSNKAYVLSVMGQHAKAIESYKETLRINSEAEWVPGECLHAMMKVCDWHDLEALKNQVISGVESGKWVVPPLAMLSLVDDPDLQLKASKIYANAKFPEMTKLQTKARHSSSRIKIAYISPDFHNHAVSILMAEVFESHDPNQFETFGVYLGPGVKDHVHERVQRAFEHFVDASALSDEEVLDYLRMHQIDIAIDLAGYTMNSRPAIFSNRCAPIQVNLIGFPGSLGAKVMDYIVADEYVIHEQAEQFYVEKPVLMPHCFQPNDSARAMPVLTVSKKEVNLPEDAFIFCSFNNGYKINPEVLATWARILRETKNSVLWLYASDPLSQENLLAEFQKCGIEKQRIVFSKRLSYEEYLGRYQLADLFLDTWPFNGGTTVSDALWVGLPVLTKEGKSFASRMAGSLLRCLGLSDLIAASKEDYVLKAIELANSTTVLCEIKQTLAEQKKQSPLFDGKLYTQHLEQAFEAMVQRQSSGLPPSRLKIQV